MTERDTEGVFRGTWEITSSEAWDKEALDLVERAHFRFDGRQGEVVMVAVSGWLDCRYGERGDKPAVEFSWEGENEGDQRCGRGWAVLEPDGKLKGHLFFHMGDDSAFLAMRTPTKKRGSGRSRRRTLTSGAAKLVDGRSRVLRELQQCGTMVAAAQALGLTPSAISRQTAIRDAF